MSISRLRLSEKNETLALAWRLEHFCSKERYGIYSSPTKPIVILDQSRQSIHQTNAVKSKDADKAF